MPDPPKKCPECGERYEWYEAECPECRVALVPMTAEEAGDPEIEIVPVFRTSDPNVMALARIALDAEGIQYDVYSDQVVFVAEDAAQKAKEILVDLTAGSTGTPAAGEPLAILADATGHSGELTVRLEDQQTRQHLGDITDAQLDFLLTHLELESSDDRDFYVDGPTIDLLADRGGDPALIELLRKALAGGEGIDIAWTDL